MVQSRRLSEHLDSGSTTQSKLRVLNPQMHWDSSACPTLPSLRGRQHTGEEEDDGKIFLFSDHLLRGQTSGSDLCVTSLPRRVSNPAWGRFHISDEE